MLIQRHIRLTPALCLLALLACRTSDEVRHAQPVTAQKIEGSVRPRDFHIVGYLPTWSGNLDEVDFARLSHINYAFVLPTPDGGITRLEDPGRLQALVARAHPAGVKVSISIGGWNDGNDSAFEKMAADPAARARFIEAVIDFVETYRLDGVDIDWEYPDAGASSTHFLDLMRGLRRRLDPLGKLLTAAIVGDGPNGAGIPAEVFAELAFANIMAYDADEGPHGERHHSSYEYAARCLQYWRGRGLPVAKTVLGVPFYGKKPGTAYRALVARDPQAPFKDQVGDVLYNGLATMKKKTALARAEASGIMIWEISEDVPGANSLLRAITDAATVP